MDKDEQQASAAQDVVVESRLDDGSIVTGWKNTLRRMIDDEKLPDTLSGLLVVFMQIGNALENFTMRSKDQERG